MRDILHGQTNDPSTPIIVFKTGFYEKSTGLSTFFDLFPLHFTRGWNYCISNVRGYITAISNYRPIVKSV